MLIAQISDTHIVERGHKTFGVAPTETNLALVIDHINRFEPKPDLVLLTGDLTDHGGASEVANAARLLNDLDCPFYIIPGNHDDRGNLWSEFAETACPVKTSEFINYVIDDFDVRLIGMDSSIKNAPGGELCDVRLAWLEKQLSEQPRRPTIIFMHHPPRQMWHIRIRCGWIPGSRRSW